MLRAYRCEASHRHHHGNVRYKAPVPTDEAAQKYHLLRPGLEPEEVQHILDKARTGDPAAFSLSPQESVQAIDPVTGDSALHIATQLESLDGINRLLGRFGPRTRRFLVWAWHALLVHQNHSGDTALHIAARSGNQDLLTMLYRNMSEHWSAEYPEIMVMDDGPPEYYVYPDDVDDTFSNSHLLLLITKNNMGRDPAAEAQYAGHDDLAQWLDDVVLRLDRRGTRRTKANVAEMIAFVKDQMSYDLWRNYSKSSNNKDDASWRVVATNGEGVGNVGGQVEANEIRAGTRSSLRL
ncbi:hypothetical protein ACJ41O_001679 [Fusarium nematophilum]